MLVRSGKRFCRYDLTRSQSLGLGGGARKAMEKREEEGEHGVTMIVGNADFSDTCSSWRSRERRKIRLSRRRF